MNGKQLLDAANPEFGRIPPPRDRLSGRALITEPSACPPGSKKTAALCDHLDDHWRRLQSLGELLLRAVAAALGDDPDFFDRALQAGGPPTSCLRFNHYAVFTDAERAEAERKARHAHKDGLACEEHRDMTLLTLLDQGGEGGLQVLQRGEWREVPLTPGALVVNSGGALQRWTNDVLVATTHRVRFVTAAERISTPFFVEAGYDSPMDCLPATVSDERPCAYERVLYGPYIHSTLELFEEYADR